MIRYSKISYDATKTVVWFFQHHFLHTLWWTTHKIPWSIVFHNHSLDYINQEVLSMGTPPFQDSYQSSCVKTFHRNRIDHEPLRRPQFIKTRSWAGERATTIWGDNLLALVNMRLVLSRLLLIHCHGPEWLIPPCVFTVINLFIVRVRVSALIVTSSWFRGDTASPRNIHMTWEEVSSVSHVSSTCDLAFTTPPSLSDVMCGTAEKEERNWWLLWVFHETMLWIIDWTVIFGSVMAVIWYDSSKNRAWQG